jgi:lipopolysaccharide transport system ATP-binding protein
MSKVISIENLSKAYRLGQIGSGTFTYDMQRWWANLRGKPNPLLKIGEQDHDNFNGEIIWALKNLSLQIEQGEVLGVIGRNGAGKSTLLKILSRVTAPTSGRIKVRGRIASLLEVGTGFHPELTGRENIYLNGAILGMSRKEMDRKFDEIVDFSEVEQFIDTPVKRYSSGMYVRLAFAVAAHLEPEILVIDEVLAVGDAEFQRKCLSKMGNVAKKGQTILFVSHNMGAIVSLCKSCIVLKNGIPIFQGEAGTATHHYMESLFQNNNTQSRSNTISIANVRIRTPFDASSALCCDQPLVIEAQFLGSIQNPEIICVIENANNEIISFQKRKGKELGVLEKAGQLKLEITYPALWLAPGIYSVYFRFLNLTGGNDGRLTSDKYPFTVTGETEETGKAILSPNSVWKVS